MRKLLLTIASFFLFVSLASADNGLISLKSHHGVKTTADRLEKTLRKKGMTVFTRIDHTANAHKVGLTLRPTELVIFGNPKLGTPLMECSQSMGIDLPQKALIWKDATGQVWLTYNDPQYLANRHGIKECGGVVQKVGKALSGFARTATMP